WALVFPSGLISESWPTQSPHRPSRRSATRDRWGDSERCVRLHLTARTAWRSCSSPRTAGSAQQPCPSPSSCCRASRPLRASTCPTPCSRRPSQHPCTGYRTSVNHSSHSSLVTTSRSSLVVAGLCPPRLTTRTLPRAYCLASRPLIRPHGLPTPQPALLLALPLAHLPSLLPLRPAALATRLA